MTDIVLRMKTLPDLTNEKAWEVVNEGAQEIERLRHSLSALAILHRYRMAEGGTQVFIGTSCEVCEAEAGDRNLRHTAECPLSVLNPK
jgi:hypothetical protein